MGKAVSTRLKIVLIGSGNVATHLGKIIATLPGYPIVQVFSKTLAHAKALGIKLQCPYSNILTEVNRNADIYLLAVKDDDISLMAEQLHDYIESKALVIHTSGSVSMKEIAPWFKNHGVFYPLQTFSKSKKNWSLDIPLLISGSNKSSKDVLINLAKKISPTILPIDDDTRSHVHLAAVFANNFANHLYVIAELLLREKKLNFQILMPLIEETTHKLKSLSPLAAQTGPARRQDKRVISKHRALLKSRSPEWLNLYNQITNMITKRYKT